LALTFATKTRGRNYKLRRCVCGIREDEDRGRRDAGVVGGREIRTGSTAHTGVPSTDVVRNREGHMDVVVVGSDGSGGHVHDDEL